jgi:hypothetical protein
MRKERKAHVKRSAQTTREEVFMLAAPYRRLGGLVLLPAGLPAIIPN